MNLSRRGPVIAYGDAGNIANVTDAATGAAIAQSAATDGGGVDFDVSAILWLAFSLIVGLPLMLVGIRVWRFTTGAGVGLAVLACIWAAFINALSANGISDIVVTIIVLVSFLLGFSIGLFKLGRAAGMACLALLGGISVGIRVVLFRPNLLVPIYGVNWAIVAILGVATFVVILFQQRVAMLIASTSVGTFLTALGVDLIINKQSGMSFGLRYLFDRNSSHVEYFYSLGWHPPLVTEIIMGFSLGLIPICAVGQHYLFKQPFYAGRKDYILSSRISSESTAREIVNDEETVGGTASLSEKKLAASEQSLPLPDIVHHSIPVPSMTFTAADDRHQPQSPMITRKESDELIGVAK
ncbi:hypothetical protein BC835DRAFT_1420024 [Cytidiella melzeri]|nr:hypothetical protein BC835DRAFT_1420024 [Cytidiella melzeri]